MIAIQNNNSGFSKRWKSYCEKKGIPFKMVDFYQSNITDHVKECNAVMWHFSHTGHIDFLMAKQLLFSLEQAGKKIFPDFNTVWHFDDKVGQKYLLEALEIPLVNSYVFYQKNQAIKWAKETKYPKVFKLRGGAGSVNVKKVNSVSEAIKLINKAFGRGFKHSSLVPLSEMIARFKAGKTPLLSVIKSLIRIFIPTDFSKKYGRAKGYIYFQDFIPNNDHDIRIIVIDEKAFAIKRMVRKNDFRASGSGTILYEKELFKESDINLAFQIHNKIKSQCTAMDFVYDKGQPKVVEISYGFSPEGYDSCPGFWDKDLNWYEGKFDPYGWMVEEVLK